MWGKTGKLRSKRRATSFYLSPQPPFIAARPRFVGRLGADRVLAEMGREIGSDAVTPPAICRNNRVGRIWFRHGALEPPKVPYLPVAARARIRANSSAVRPRAGRTKCAK